MTVPLFKDQSERAQILVLAAAIASHGIVAGGQYAGSLDDPADRQALLKGSFDLAEDFIAEAEQRLR